MQNTKDVLLGTFQQDTSPIFLLLGWPKKQSEGFCGLFASSAQSEPLKIIFNRLTALDTAWLQGIVQVLQQQAAQWFALVNFPPLLGAQTYKIPCGSR